MPLIKVDVSIVMGKVSIIKLQFLINDHLLIFVYFIIFQSFFNKKDYSDEKYLRKKAFYLHCLAKELIKIPELVDNDIQFSYSSCSYYSPALIVKPSDSLGKKCCFCLRVVPEINTYSLHTFSPSINNINHQWYFKSREKDGK